MNKYFLKFDVEDIGWQEVTLAQYIEAERKALSTIEDLIRDDTVSGFSGGSVCGRIEYGSSESVDSGKE